MGPMRQQGWAVWLLALFLMLSLPGAIWKPAPPPPFPWEALLPAGLVVGALVMGSLAGAAQLGPRTRSSRLLTLLESPPDLVWGGLVLALWPSTAGPPGMGAWMIAFLATALPGEIRWLGQALPDESPFPAAWGHGAVRTARLRALRALVPQWLGARLPLWITGGLVLERILGFQGLGSDWCQRVAVRDRMGMGIWLLGLALLWRLANPPTRQPQ